MPAFNVLGVTSIDFHLQQDAEKEHVEGSLNI
jgi:hypothetical protein